GQVKLWDADRLQELRTLSLQQPGVLRVAFPREGPLLAIGYAKGNVRLWDLDANKEAGQLPGHAGPVLGLAFRPDSRALATSGADGTVRLWDLASLRASKTITVGPTASASGKYSWLGQVAFSSDGRFLATA